MGERSDQFEVDPRFWRATELMFAAAGCRLLDLGGISGYALMQRRVRFLTRLLLGALR